MKKNKNTNFSLTELPEEYNFNGIDIMKFICSILVCMIHIAPIPKYLIENSATVNYYIQNCLCRIAVPFYFVAAGFFLFRKIDLNNLNTMRIKEYCLKIFRFLGIWTVLLFIGKKDQLWYLGALVISIAILTILLLRKIKLEHIITISLLLFLIGLIGDSYYGFTDILKNIPILKILISSYETTFKTTRNGLFFGTIFVLIGIIFAHKKIKINMKVSYICLAISIILLLVESYLLKTYSNPKDHNMYLSLVPTILFIFYIVSHIKIEDKIIYKKLRIIGVLVFYLHLFIDYFIKLDITLIKNNTSLDFSSFNFPLVLSITILISIFIEELSTKEKFKWLKYLYS